MQEPTFLEQFVNPLVSAINSYLFHEYVVFTLLGIGVLFTIWTWFGQWRAITHGVAVIRGKYDDHDDPGAINHFQALSAALSATVGLGNIAGVAVAVALGGPGAIFWMWMIGLVGMALKMTEVTQSMLYRNLEDPDNPHGGPMFVAKYGLEKAKEGGLGLVAGIVFGLTVIAITALSGIWWVIAIGVLVAAAFVVLGFTRPGVLGSAIGGIFVITLIISAITGGNMFQSWSVADITRTYFPDFNGIVTGAILATVVAAVIIGGIKRIGKFAAAVVPLMCVAYLLAGLYVLALHLEEVPAMLALIVRSGLPEWLGGSNAEPAGAFLGGTFAYAAVWGVKRALFSSEAGQGSAPIAHSAAKTDEPVREGIVAGLEPFIDTIVVCSITALVILATGAYDRGAEAIYDAEAARDIEITLANEAVAELEAGPDFTTTLPVAGGDLSPGDAVFAFGTVEGDERGPFAVPGVVVATPEALAIDWVEETLSELRGIGAETTLADVELAAPTVYRGRPTWTLRTPPLPDKTAEAREILAIEPGQPHWHDGETIFMVVRAQEDLDTGRDLRRYTGKVDAVEVSEDGDVEFRAVWNPLESRREPHLVEREGGLDAGVYGDYAGPSLTAHAFDRAAPGLGMWLVTIVAWLFAISTMISWSYYGEQGIVYLGGNDWAVFIYKLAYCAIIFLTGVALHVGAITTDAELDMWTTLGLGVMLVANIPIMLIFSRQAMRAYHNYFHRIKTGEMEPAHKAPPFEDVVEGKDVE